MVVFKKSGSKILVHPDNEYLYGPEITKTGHPVQKQETHQEMRNGEIGRAGLHPRQIDGQKPMHLAGMQPRPTIYDNSGYDNSGFLNHIDMGCPYAAPSEQGNRDNSAVFPFTGTRFEES